MCPFYGDVRFIESPSKNQNTLKVNMKSTICHDFQSPDLLEGPKDGKIKENAEFSSFQRLQTRLTTLVHLTTDHEVHIVFSQSFMMVCLIFHTAIIINRKTGE